RMRLPAGLDAGLDADSGSEDGMPVFFPGACVLAAVLNLDSLDLLLTYMSVFAARHKISIRSGHSIKGKRGAIKRRRRTMRESPAGGGERAGRLARARFPLRLRCRYAINSNSGKRAGASRFRMTGRGP